MAKWFRVQDFQLHPLGSNLALVTGASVTLVNRQMICLLPVEVFSYLFAELGHELAYHLATPRWIASHPGTHQTTKPRMESGEAFLGLFKRLSSLLGQSFRLT